MPHVCSWQHVRIFDNFLRPLVHNPQKMFGPYINPGMKVMDVGCGAGFASIGLARMVGEEGKVVAVDLQPEMLAMVAKRAEKAGLSGRIITHQCTQDTLGLEEVFDFVNAFYMIHEVPDTEKFFAEVHLLLHPKGKFFIAEPAFHVSAKRFTRMLETARNVGLKVCDQPKIRFSRTVVFGVI